MAKKPPITPLTLPAPISHPRDLPMCILPLRKMKYRLVRIRTMPRTVSILRSWKPAKSQTHTEETA